MLKGFISQGFIVMHMQVVAISCNQYIIYIVSNLLNYKNKQMTTRIKILVATSTFLTISVLTFHTLFLSTLLTYLSN